MPYTSAEQQRAYLREYDRKRDPKAQYENLKFRPQQRKRTGEWIECQTCGREFYVVPGRIRHAAKMGTQIRFCSRACYATGSHGEGNPFWGKRHPEETRTRMREHPERKRFEFTPGPTNPNTTRFSPDWRPADAKKSTWYRKFFLRTAPRCMRCGYDSVPAILELHHVDRNPRHNTEANLLLLCPNCHSLDHFHAKDGRFGGYPASKWPEGWTPWMNTPQKR